MNKTEEEKVALEIQEELIARAKKEERQMWVMIWVIPAIVTTFFWLVSLAK